jgi:hypothetical protein
MKPPPSEEAFREVYDVVTRCVARPGERVAGIVLFVLTEGPDGDAMRLVISPADAEQAMLRLCRPYFDDALGTPPASGDAP